MNTKKAMMMIPVFQVADPDSLDALSLCGVIRGFKKGEHLFLEKDEVKYLYFLVQGTAGLYKLSNKQEKRVLLICGAGMLLNEELVDERRTSVNCEMLSDAYVLCIETRRFLEVCEQDFGLSKAVMDAMALKIRRLYRQIKNTGNHVRSDKRIAARLWKLSRDHGVPCEQGTQIGFDLTITYLADLLGMKRETVSRQVTMLADRELLIMSKSRFIIPDRNKLKNYFQQT